MLLFVDSDNVFGRPQLSERQLMIGSKRENNKQGEKQAIADVSFYAHGNEKRVVLLRLAYTVTTDEVERIARRLRIKNGKIGSWDQLVCVPCGPFFERRFFTLLCTAAWKTHHDYTKDPFRVVAAIKQRMNDHGRRM